MASVFLPRSHSRIGIIVLAIVLQSVGCTSKMTSQENSRLIGTFSDLLDYDTPPVMTKAVTPMYPDLARDMRVEGKVILKALILEDGTLGGIEVIESVHPMLLDQAVTALRQCEFKPARKNGEPVRATLIVPFIFELEGHHYYSPPNRQRERENEAPPISVEEPTPSEPETIRRPK